MIGAMLQKKHAADNGGQGCQSTRLTQLIENKNNDNISSVELSHDEFATKFEEVNKHKYIDVEQAYRWHLDVCSDSITMKEVKQHIQQKNPKADIHCNTYMRNNGIWPILTPYDVNKSPNRYTDGELAKRDIKSWFNNNEYRYNEKQAKLKQYQDLRSRITDEQYNLWTEFLSECDNIEYGIRYGFVKTFKNIKKFPKGFTSRNKHYNALQILKQLKYEKIWDKMLFARLFKCHMAFEDYTNWNEEGSVHFTTHDGNIMIPFDTLNNNFPRGKCEIKNGYLYTTLAAVDGDKPITIKCYPTKQGKNHKIDGNVLTYTYGKRKKQEVTRNIGEIGLVYRDGEYYINLINKQKLEYKKLDKYTCGYLCSYLSGNLTKPKNDKIIVPYGTRFLSIDLNKRPVVSWCVAELKEFPTTASYPAADGLGHIEIIAEGHIGEPYYSDLLHMPECCSDMRKLKAANRICRELKHTQKFNDDEQELFEYFVKKYNINVNDYSYFSCNYIISKTFDKIKKWKKSITTKVHKIITDNQDVTNPDQNYIYADRLYEIELEKTYIGLVTALSAPQQKT